MAGVKVGQERWDSVLDLWMPYLEHHYLTFNDMQAMMCALGSKKEEISQTILQSMKDYGAVDQPFNKTYFNHKNDGMIISTGTEYYLSCLGWFSFDNYDTCVS